MGSAIDNSLRIGTLTHQEFNNLMSPDPRLSWQKKIAVWAKVFFYRFSKLVTENKWYHDKALFTTLHIYWLKNKDLLDSHTKLKVVHDLFLMFYPLRLSQLDSKHGEFQQYMQNFNKQSETPPSTENISSTPTALPQPKSMETITAIAEMSEPTAPPTPPSAETFSAVAEIPDEAIRPLAAIFTTPRPLQPISLNPSPAPVLAPSLVQTPPQALSSDPTSSPNPIDTSEATTNNEPKTEDPQNTEIEDEEVKPEDPLETEADNDTEDDVKIETPINTDDEVEVGDNEVESPPFIPEITPTNEPEPSILPVATDLYEGEPSLLIGTLIDEVSSTSTIDDVRERVRKLPHHSLEEPIASWKDLLNYIVEVLMLEKAITVNGYKIPEKLPSSKNVCLLMTSVLDAKCHIPEDPLEIEKNIIEIKTNLFSLNCLWDQLIKHAHPGAFVANSLTTLLRNHYVALAKNLSSLLLEKSDTFTENIAKNHTAEAINRLSLLFSQYNEGTETRAQFVSSLGELNAYAESIMPLKSSKTLNERLSDDSIETSVSYQLTPLAKNALVSGFLIHFLVEAGTRMLALQSSEAEEQVSGLAKKPKKKNRKHPKAEAPIASPPNQPVEEETTLIAPPPFVADT